MPCLPPTPSSPNQGEGPDAQLPVAPLPTVLSAEGFGADGLLRIRGRKLKEPLEAPVPALFWAAGLSFSRSQLIQEVRGEPAITSASSGCSAVCCPQARHKGCHGQRKVNPSLTHAPSAPLHPLRRRPTLATCPGCSSARSC